MALLIGLLTAGAYGSADFFGGFATRRNPLGAVVFTMMAVGLVVAPLLLIAFPEPFPSARVVWLSAGIGVIGTASVALLYTGLAMGRMSVVAPISAVGGSVIPVFWGIARGERPSAIAIVGVVAAICAIGLVARGPGAEPIGGGSRTRELAVAVGAGIGFGVVFIFFAETGDSAGFWPVLLSRCFSVPIVLGLALVTGRILRLPPAALKPAGAAGLLDVSANALQLLALRRGLVTLVAPVAGLYPAITVLLARTVLKERMRRTQIVGLVVALTGLVLIAIG
ncbi:MAG: DMT family transporter [Acidimicrobiia bacterium]|nr:DMT family transporter [Acidimicrobiia bacterium]